MEFEILQPEAIRSSEYSQDPYPHFLGSNFIREDKIDAMRRDFPQISKPGFLTVNDITLADSFAQLIKEIESPELTEVLSDRFGLDLTPFPRLTTIRRLSQLKDGRIHTDGQSKVMTMLVYLNDTWDAESAGRLRVLYDGEHFEPYACEVPPVMGTVFGFLRSDHSWHGHPPFAGERRVVQTAWIRDAAELERKKKRNTFAKVLKGIFGR